MSSPIESFQRLLTGYFRELILATAYLGIGQQAIKQSPPSASIALTLGNGVTTEPMFLHELQAHSPSVAFGIAELFQTKAIAAWADLLNDLFELFVELHISGGRQFPVFKTKTTRFDFSSNEDVATQVRLGLVADFAFAKYADRVKTIGRVLTPNAMILRELLVVRKHVSIRNSTQHHSGKVYAEMLRELGSDSLELLNQGGDTVSLTQGQSIELYVTELDHLKSSLFMITNEWRSQLAAYTNGSNT